MHPWSYSPKIMDKTTQIGALDRHFLESRPAKLDITSPTTSEQINGRFIYAKKPSGLYEQLNPEIERIPNIQETVQMRLWAIEELLKEIPELKTAIERLCKGENLKKVAQTISKIRTRLAAKINNIWKVRLTTSSHMVRANDELDKDTVFFYNGSPFENAEATKDAMDGEISDGGVRYNPAAIQIIQRETPQSSRLPYSEYLAAPGGNFSGTDFLNHPVFSTAIGNRNLMEDYAWALNVLNLVDFYNPGFHSGWRPGEMKPGFGRPIALGYKGEAFYPPNNSTVDHCAVVIPRTTKIDTI